MLIAPLIATSEGKVTALSAALEAKKKAEEAACMCSPRRASPSSPQVTALSAELEAKKKAVREAVGKATDPPLSGISKVLMDHFLEVQSPVSCAPRAAFIMCD